MNSSFASSYKRQTYTEITKESLNESILNHKLSLRKVKLENKLMEKRTMSLSRESSHQINLNELNFPEEIAKDVNNYIRSKFDIKSIFSYLFSDDLLQVKRSIYLLRVYIVLQVSELEMEKRFLSRNDYDIVNKLCSFLICLDLQLQYEASWCLTNLCLFPEKIEQRMKTPNNLKFISQFVFSSENDLFINATFLLGNIASKVEEKEYFIKQNVLEYILNKAVNGNFSGRDLLPMLRCVSNIFKIVQLKNEYRKYLISSIPNIIKIFSSLNTSDLKTQLDLYPYIVDILKNYLQPYNNQIYNSILSTPFPKMLISQYLNQNDFSIRATLIELMIVLLVGSESHVQILLDEGLIDILKQCLDEFKLSNKALLKNVIFGLSNIACGTEFQIQLLHKSLIFQDILNIAKQMYELILKSPSLKEEKEILLECLYVLSYALNEASDQTIYDIFSYENHIIVDLLFFGLKEYNEMKLISCILIGIKKLIIMEENIMSDDSIKRMIKEKGIEDFLEKELSGKRFNEEQENTAEIIIDAIKDEDIELPRNNK